jgi:CarboxypepD_reg-like domain/TonB dependent receptor/TonB-dependent Receptor Plug Domain
MLKNKYLFTLFIAFFSFLSTNAQEDQNAIALKTVLEQIIKQHDIRFDYIEKDIADFKIISPQKSWSLDAKIEYLKKSTQLEFKVIDQKYYTITQNNKIDKKLCGYIIDNETGLAVENVVIAIINTNIAVGTDKNGYFEIAPITSNQIETRHLGYQTLIVNQKDLRINSCPKIKLSPVTLQLDEVVTNRYLTTGILKLNDGTIIIKPKKFGILPGLIEPDVLQTMQQIPGIYSTDETISNINVRGGTHDQNLFLWNGIRMFQTGHFFGLISAFNPSLANTIAISKNGTSAFYDDGVSSLVNISSHSKSIEKSQNSFSINLISAEFYSKIKASEKASIEISGRRSYTDAISTPTYINYRNRIFQNTIITNVNKTLTDDFKTNEKFYFYDFSIQYQQKIGSKHELNIDGIAIQNNLDIKQTSALENRNSNLSQSNFGGNLTWKTTWNDNNTSQIQFNTSYYNLDSNNESIKVNQILTQQNTVFDTGIQLKNTHQISKTFSFNNGYQYNEKGVTNFDKINSPFLSRKIKEVIRSHALVLEGIYESGSKNTFLNLGLRSNYFEKFHTFLLEPRIQLSQKLSPNFSIEILGEQKSQTLSQIIDLQQDFLGIEKRRWELSNTDNIPIQKSNQMAIGLTYKDNDWLVTLDNFYKKVNGITTSSQSFQNQFELIKTTGNYNVIGTEALIQRNFGKFYTWLNYSYNKNSYLFEMLSKDKFPNNYELIHSVAFAAIYECEKWKMAFGSKWHSGKPYTTLANNKINIDDPSNPKINYNQANDNKLKDYIQLNFSAARNWKLSDKLRLTGSFSVLNMLNNKNIINRYYRINKTENSIESVDTYSQAVTQNINLKLLF